MKIEDENFNNIALISSALIRVTAIERVLISKGLITNDELLKEITEITEMITKSIFKNVKNTNDLVKKNLNKLND